MKNNQQGFTLIEVLASVTILTIAIISITFIVQNTTIFSRENSRMDEALQITRVVMEEFNQNLAVGSTIPIFNDQEINFTATRMLVPSLIGEQSVGVISYPDLDDPTYTIEIFLSPITGEANTYIVKDQPYYISDYFVNIRLVCTNLLNNRTFELEALVEYN